MIIMYFIRNPKPKLKIHQYKFSITDDKVTIECWIKNMGNATAEETCYKMISLTKGKEIIPATSINHDLTATHRSDWHPTGFILLEDGESCIFRLKLTWDNPNTLKIRKRNSHSFTIQKITRSQFFRLIDIF